MNEHQGGFAGAVHLVGDRHPVGRLGHARPGHICLNLRVQHENQETGRNTCQEILERHFFAFVYHFAPLRPLNFSVKTSIKAGIN
jgi:hypothetical protein